MLRRLIAFCALGLLFGLNVGAQEETTPALATDLGELRKTVEHQTKQLEALVQEVARLRQVIEKHPAEIAAPDPSAIHAPTPPAGEVADAPKAILAGSGGVTHVVAKGETLTSIAKLYKVTVSDLLKLNKIENERTLQISQTLVIPSPKTPDQPRNP